MSDLIRCPSCLGAKRVPGLGSIINDCNLCEATGKIKACDKPVSMVIEPVIVVKDLIDQVADCAPVSVIDVIAGAVVAGEHKVEIESNSNSQAKRQVFQRKKG